MIIIYNIIYSQPAARKSETAVLIGSCRKKMLSVTSICKQIRNSIIIRNN